MTQLKTARLCIALAALAFVATTTQPIALAQPRERGRNTVPTPTGVTASAGNGQVTLAWQAATGAATYSVYRRAANERDRRLLAERVAGLGYIDTAVVNGVVYYYRLQAVNGATASHLSARVSATPTGPPPPTAPAGLTATPGNARVALQWQALTGATGYRVYRATGGAAFGTMPLASPTTPSYTDTTAVTGITYQYAVAAFNGGGTGPLSAPVTATPVAPLPPPTGVAAAAGHGQVTISWSTSAGATSYRIYRGIAAGAEATTAVASPTASPLTDTGRANGQAYYYVVTAVNAVGESARSAEVNATPQAPEPPTDLAAVAAYRFLRQATWGPKPAEVDTLRSAGIPAFFAEQLAAAPSVFPDALLDQSVEWSQERFMQNGMTGLDQLRQRMAWTLHKIWVVSAEELDSAPAMLGYYRTLMTDAFANYRTVMRDLTLNPSMGRYLNMLNSTKQFTPGDPPPNENYARELLQLFTMGLARLNPNGTPITDANGTPVPSYTEADVRALARLFTGWTWGDGAPGAPTDFGSENYLASMEAVEAYHDTGAKFFLGATFAAGQTARQDLDQALTLIFNHPNVGPFVAKQLIQQFVTSNPSPAYVQAVTAVFNDNGGGVRGDLAAVIRVVLTHADAGVTAATTGKLAEPVLFVLSQLRALNATVADHPFMTDRTAEMGQKIFYPPSVFSYFSPGFRVRGTGTTTTAPLVGPEFQHLTTVTSLLRANFVGALLGGHFGNAVTVNYEEFQSRAATAATLVDYTSVRILGGRLTGPERAEIIAAVSATPPTDTLERVRTALYLMLVLAQNQVDR